MSILNDLIQEHGDRINVVKDGVVHRVASYDDAYAYLYGGIQVPRYDEGWEIELPSLEDQKVARICCVDMKTQSLIATGFAYDGNTFSLSGSAQLNWTGLLAADASGLVDYPHTVTTQDDQEYQIGSSTQLKLFIGSAMMAIEVPIATGRALKLALNAATTQAELDAVIDNR